MKRFIAIAAAVCTASSSVSGQVSSQNAEQTRKITDNAHLVGHEDELLLKRIEDALGEWDPRNLQSPYLIQIGADAIKKEGVTVGERARYALRRPDLAEFIADPDAAVALGKALFWEMRAGSDSGSKDRQGNVFGTACASCHFRFGADSRSKNTEAIAYQAWEKFLINRDGVIDPGPDSRIEKLPFTQRKLTFVPNGEQEVSRSKFDLAAPGLLQHEIIGSAGIFFRRFAGWDPTSQQEQSSGVGFNPDRFLRADMFAIKDANGGDVRTRQVTQRNSPSIFNAVFNDRQFHDGRAESTFNGFSIFGDFDKRVILKRVSLNSDGSTRSVHPTSVAIVNASLASQAVGPIVNEVEMSYQGRTFHDLAVKLLQTQPLADQAVSATDSVFSSHVKPGAQGLFDRVEIERPDGSKESKYIPSTYRKLIQRAFRKEWWADDKALTEDPSLRSRLDLARQRFIDLNNKLTADRAELKDTLNRLLTKQPKLQFPASALVNAILTKFKKPEDRPSEVAALLTSANEWSEIEAEILPLRLYTPINRQHIDEKLASMVSGPGDITAQNDLMVNNFGLYWGLSIMLYESTLISNRSPFDEMMRGNGKPVNDLWAKLVTEPVATDSTEPQDDPNLPAEGARAADEKIRKVQLDKLTTRNAPPILNGAAMFQRGFRVFVLNCADCHEPPFFTAAADLELVPELPEPIAQMHAHSLIKTALADAFKVRLLEENQPIGGGVTNSNRGMLGRRRFFFDQERIPELEKTQQKLLIENMPIPDRRPISFNTGAPFPGQPAPDRVPMITWGNSRPPLGFEVSPKPGEKPLEPYAFYDLGFYNLGVSEPRYDWGAWKPAMDTIKENLIGMSAAATTGNAPGNTDDVAAGIGSLGSAYTLPRKFTLVPPTPVGAAAANLENQKPEDHSRERSYLDEPNHRGEIHFFKRARRMVMTEEPWGHRKPFISDNELMGWGAFKTPTLRNVSLTEPYMHNGRFLTLRQVLAFYSFDNPDLIPAHPELNPDLHPEMGRLAFNSDGTVRTPAGQTIGKVNVTQIQDAEALLFFLHCLTDDRVAREKGPFDHPSIRVPNGFNHDNPFAEDSIGVVEVGTEGHSPQPQFPSSR